MRDPEERKVDEGKRGTGEAGPPEGLQWRQRLSWRWEVRRS